MAFRTALFYDIENLLKGDSFSHRMIMNLSLKAILESIRKAHDIDGVAVQRAYANWSDPRLAAMRGEINELGIDPVQVFGFSREQKKNAAEIQMAIDAIDLAYTRSTIDSFVIVSGDGGFAALAKKLHEYGKTVIGCAYRSTTNNVFRAVCDGFVWIDDPEVDADEESEGLILAHAEPPDPSQVTDPRNQRLVQKIQRLTDATKAQVVEKTRKILAWYKSDTQSKTDLSRHGIFLSVVQEALKYSIPGFQAGQMGYSKFSEYLQYVCAGNEFCVARPPGSGAVLALRQRINSNWEILPDMDSRETHTVENYRALLASGAPTFRLPDETVMIAVATWLVKHGRSRESLGGLIEKIVVALPQHSSESIKLALLSFSSGGVFIREPEGVQISEQSLRLRQELAEPHLVLEQVAIGVEQKLIQVIGDFRRDVLHEIIASDFS